MSALGSDRCFAHSFPDSPVPGFEGFAERYANELTDAILSSTWHRIRAGKGLKHHDDIDGPDMYIGLAGIAHLLWRRYKQHGAPGDLTEATEIVDYCEAQMSSSRRGHKPPIPTFIMGLPGLWALGAAVAHASDNHEAVATYVNKIEEFAASGAVTHRDTPHELLYGRAGFLYVVLFLQSILGHDYVGAEVWGPIISDTISGGMSAGKGRLFYVWHGSPYLGAAHGLVGICTILLHFPLAPDQKEIVLKTLRYILTLKMPSGNYPSEEGNPERDRLVQWCHGAAGVAISFATIFKLTGDVTYLTAARDAAEVVWQRGLLKKLSLCHGVAGNACCFLSLRRAELVALQSSAPIADVAAPAKYLARAQQFMSFLVKGPDPRKDVAQPHWQDLVASGDMHGGDKALSLFEGAAGVAYACLNLCNPDLLEAVFPAYEVPEPVLFSKS